eukprot:351243-Chlamydomonas_euryale.AAC.2
MDAVRRHAHGTSPVVMRTQACSLSGKAHTRHCPHLLCSRCGQHVRPHFASASFAGLPEQTRKHIHTVSGASHHANHA